MFAFNRVTNAPVDGDAANITCEIALDGGSRTPTNDTNPTPQGGGYYLFSHTAAESNGVTVDPYPVSSTANVQVIVVHHDRYTRSELRTGQSYRWTNTNSGTGFDDVTVSEN